jgi:hypothetical protein
MVKGITTLPKRKMFPASVLLPSESEIYSTLLEANLSQGPKGRQRSNPEHTQQALFAEKLRRDNFKKPQFHPHPTAHREGIAAHQELRNLRSVTDKLQDMLNGLTNAPQIRHKFLNRKQSMLRNRRLALARSVGHAPTEYDAQSLFDNPLSPTFSDMGEVPAATHRSHEARMNPARMADRMEGNIVARSAQQQAAAKAGPSKAPSNAIGARVVKAIGALPPWRSSESH